MMYMLYTHIDVRLCENYGTTVFPSRYVTVIFCVLSPGRVIRKSAGI